MFVSTQVFQTFSCQEFPEVGKHYLRADGRIECNTPIHRVYMIYASVMIVLCKYSRATRPIKPIWVDI